MEVAGHNMNVYKEHQAINENYANTGFDKGHLNPNFYHCDGARKATFTLTNAVPQDPCFNEQIWYDMAKKAKEIMKDLCCFPGAKRYFVTGAVPKNRMIPNEEHDMEYDRTRNYNQVSVPSHMWTAACCDSSGGYPVDQGKGFSFGYYGENKPDSLTSATTVRGLETELMELYNPTGGASQQIRIFTDYCNEYSSNYQSALSIIKEPVSKMMSNAVQQMSNMKESTLPAKKRKTNLLIDGAIQKNTAANWALINADIGILLNRNEVAEYRKKVGEFGLSLLLIWTPHIEATTGNKYVHVELDGSSTSNYQAENGANSGHGKGTTQRFRYPFSYRSLNVKNQKQRTRFSKGDAELARARPLKTGLVKDDADYEIPNKDVYLVVLEASHDGAITVEGDRCRPGMKCDYQGGYEYKWCYTNWDNNSWGKCCIGDCLKFSFKDSPFCPVHKTGRTPPVPCSIRSSMIAVNGRRCLQDHPCGLHGQNYHWCYIAITGATKTRWAYCCQPWHECAVYGDRYKWCYTGKKAKTNWQHCEY